MIDGFEYGYAQAEDTMWCIRREGQSRMLCGNFVGFVPVAQPAHPNHVHRACREAMYGAGRAAREVKKQTGICPACEGVVPVEGGRIQRHGIFRQRGPEMVEDLVPCMGVNMRPKRVRR